jgi:hypothetical protein
MPRFRTHKLYAAYLIGMRHHSGQWSRGYALQCWAADHLIDRGIDDPTRFPMRLWSKKFLSQFRAYYRRLWRQRRTM